MSGVAPATLSVPSAEPYAHPLPASKPATSAYMKTAFPKQIKTIHVRDLRGVIEREQAEIGVLISMEPPTTPMLKEAADAGFYQPPALADRYPRLQILTIAELLMGKPIQFPRLLEVTYKRAPKAKGAAPTQLTLGHE